ncbi:hypothetical protein [Agrobacterium sp. 22117]|uniref:hypothetical protein n=1 Tax=Agrobacterium sp. 22117 TaxID=3453880 RepID=UPI003F8324EB
MKENRAARIALKAIRFALFHAAIKPADRRSVEIYLLVTTCGVNQAIAADVCGCTKQNVSKLLKSVEDRRDQAEFDRALSALEAVIVGE